MNDAQTLHQAGVLPTAGNVYRHFNGKVLSIVGMVVGQPGRHDSAIVIFSQVPFREEGEDLDFSRVDHTQEQWLPISEFAQEHLVAGAIYELGAHLVLLTEASAARWNWKEAHEGGLLGNDGKPVEFDPDSSIEEWNRMDEDTFIQEQNRCLAMFMPSRTFLNIDPLV